MNKDAFDVAARMNYGVASILSWSICNSETGITRIGVPMMTIASFKR